VENEGKLEEEKIITELYAILQHGKLIQNGYQSII
jgi:hypothetical protein